MVAFTAAPATLGECQRAHPSLCPWHRMGMELSKHKVYDWVPTKKIFAQELQLFLLFQLFYLKLLIIFFQDCCVVPATKTMCIYCENAVFERPRATLIVHHYFALRVDFP